MSLYISETTSIVFKTLPFIALRAFIYFLFGLAFVFYFFIVFLIGRTASAIYPQSEFIVWLVGFIISFPLIRLAREYLLYLVKAAHVAVIAMLATEGKIPDDVSQLSYGKKLVTDNFKQSSILFLVDRMIHGTVTALNGMMMRMTDFLTAVPGIDGLRKIVRGILYFSLTYIDEAVLARHFIKPSANIWDNARQGLILYAQTWKSLLGSAFVAGLFTVISFPIFLILMLGPALAMSIGHTQERWLFVMIGVIAAWLLKAIFIEPFTLTMMIVTYLKETKDLVPNAEWEQKLATLSSKFRSIQEKALQPAQ